VELEHKLGAHSAAAGSVCGEPVGLQSKHLVGDELEGRLDVYECVIGWWMFSAVNGPHLRLSRAPVARNHPHDGLPVQRRWVGLPAMQVDGFVSRVQSDVSVKQFRHEFAVQMPQKGAIAEH
jgi:hypothetical protein